MVVFYHLEIFGQVVFSHFDLEIITLMSSLRDFNFITDITRIQEYKCKIDQTSSLESALCMREKQPNVQDENALALQSSGKLKE